LMSSTSSLI